MRARLVAWVVVGVTLLLAGVAATWAATLEVRLPEPTGEHAVGRSFGSFGDSRRVAFTLYFPAQPGTGEPGPYVPLSVAERMAESDLGAFRYLPDAWGRVHHPARDGATWAGGRYPLVVFAPGAQTQAAYYSSLAAELASHGYAVAVLAQPGVTPLVAYEDGTFIESAPPLMPRGEIEAMRAFEERVDLVASDVLAAATHVAASPFARDHLDGRVAAVGHSLGGAGAAEAAARDERILAVADLDGSLGDEARAGPLARPVLFLQDQGRVAPADAAARRAFAAGGAPGALETIEGASHATFVTDTGFFEEVRPFGAQSDDLGAEDAWRAVSGALVRFLDDALG